MPRTYNYQEIKKRLIKEYPIFVAGVIDTIEDETDFDLSPPIERSSANTVVSQQGIRRRGRVTRTNDRRLKRNRGR